MNEIIGFNFSITFSFLIIELKLKFQINSFLCFAVLLANYGYMFNYASCFFDEEDTEPEDQCGELINEIFCESLNL